MRDWQTNMYTEAETPEELQPTSLTPAQLKAQQDAAAQQALANQILGTSDSSKWQGEGFGSAQANARNMAEILSGAGITDVSQFGKVQIQVPDVGWQGGTEDGGYVPLGTTHTEEVWGNTATGQALPNTYGERQTGNAWGGTYAGSGNTGYRVQFDAQGNPHFYTTGASSNTLLNILADNPALNVAANVLASVYGGPAGVAALQAAQGKSLEDVAKATALSWAGQQVGNVVSDYTGDALNTATGVEPGFETFNAVNNLSPYNQAAIDSTIGKVVGNAAQQYVASNGKTDLGDALLYGGINTGVNLVANQVPGYKDLPAPVRTFVDKSVSSVIKDGNLSDQALQSAAIAAGVDAMKIGMADYKSNFPLDAKARAELSPEEKAAYDSGGMRGLQNFTLQNQILDKSYTYKEGEAAPTAPAESEHDAFLRSIGITPDTTGQWASPTNQEILDMFYGGNSAADTVDVTGARVSGAEPGFENWVDPTTVLVTDKAIKDATEAAENNITVTGDRYINAGDESVFNPGTTYNAGNESVFDPGTKVVDTKKVTDPTSKITVTPPTTTTTPTTSTKTTTSTAPTSSSSGSGSGGMATSETPLSDVELMEEIFGTHLFTNAPKAPSKTAKAATGGSIDDLLQLLRS